MKVLRRLVQNWNTYWYTPQSPADLSIVRILFYPLLFHFLGHRFPLEGWGELATDSMWSPISFFTWLPFKTFSPAMAGLLVVIWQIAIIASALGVVTWLSTKVTFLLGIYIIGLPFNFGKIDHSSHLPLVICGILAFSRCGDLWSVDWLIQRWRRRIPPKNDGAYHWPIMLAKSYMAIMYFEAGYQKWLASGFRWVFSQNFQIMLLTRPTVTPLGLWVSNYPFLCVALAGIAICIETLAPLALFFPRLAMVIVPMLFSFHIGTLLLMGNHGYFLPYDIAYVVWVPWSDLIHWVKVRLVDSVRFASLTFRSAKLIR